MKAWALVEVGRPLCDPDRVLSGFLLGKRDWVHDGRLSESWPFRELEGGRICESSSLRELVSL